jgi:hypothetical protein
MRNPDISVDKYIEAVYFPHAVYVKKSCRGKSA